MAALSTRLVLMADTVADLMTSNVVSIRADATVVEAIALLTGKGLTAAPVIDEAGKPVGVVSRTDILLHERQHPSPTISGSTEVQDIMTPAVFSISQDAPAARAVEDLLALNVHQLYVLDAGDALVGTVCAKDVLQKLHGE
jgi:CBS domain-containing protein